MAYYTGDPGISLLGQLLHQKSVRVSEVNFYLPPASPMPDTVGLVETCKLSVSVFALLPVNRHNKELVEAHILIFKVRVKGQCHMLNIVVKPC